MRVLALLAAAMLVAGCGQKGDLYLPDKQASVNAEFISAVSS